MRILHVSSECAPWAKSGGLGDVVGALPDALCRADDGVQAAVVMPFYRKAQVALAKRGLAPSDTGIVADVSLGPATARVRFLRLDRPGRAPVFFAANDAAFGRDGLYGYDDDSLRFILFSKAVVGVARELLGAPPHVIHCHDWHTGLIPGLVATNARALLPGTRTVMTVHNLAYQGICSKELLPLTGLSWDVFHLDAYEWFDHINLLKGGMALANAVTTVSPTYAREIQTPEFGAQLDGFLRRRRVFGILNGIDTEEWDPTSDPHLAAHYDADHLDGKRAVRAALLQRCGWSEQPEVPVLGVVSRMTAQKGLDLVLALISELYAFPARLVVLGTGVPRLEDGFRLAARHYGRNVRAQIAFDVPLSHALIAGCDALLVPSRFEPCGLTQMYAMRCGTVPIVHATGGLADTVRDPGDGGLAGGEGTGFAFGHPTAVGLRWAIGRAVRMFREHPEGWRTIQRTGMARDWSWSRSAADYLRLYRAL
ncbi:glycogen synthase GlgA [Pseudenhygromyxa sp. WMMC2535]|uniref:glycogen synthase GlgA n=1 Tax=Pseudenhygromyxa sp. WMMC2535 TaxID=2712867 RepID=UPI001557529B|nr:glycogen synthase GlgA [Pseudenhygromyxa sp. WMMC2535]NVB42512.1 glycogen synthase GlgA [Pseudenhygromyxa sp. WMMC2535]